MSTHRPRLPVAAPLFSGLALCLLLAAGPAAARDRYGAYPAVKVAPDLAAEWVLQLSPGSGVVPGYRRPHLEGPAVGASGVLLKGQMRVVRAPRGTVEAANGDRTGSVNKPAAGTSTRAVAHADAIDPAFLPQLVDYQTAEAPGTVIIDTNARFLYRVEEGGKARRYGVGVGKPGFEWAGTHVVSQKREWPTWTPPSQMRARERKKGKVLPEHMAGGPQNPLGARAMYLGSTLYRIHGTNQPWSIGKAVSSGCIRMRNEDVTDLYERVSVGTRVIVL